MKKYDLDKKRITCRACTKLIACVRYRSDPTLVQVSLEKRNKK